MSGTPVLLDVTDTPGEKERRASVRQRLLLLKQVLESSSALAARKGLEADTVLGSRVFSRPRCKGPL